MGKQRPIGFNDKPIPHGMLYSDYTTEQIEAACNAPDFEEKCKHAQDNAERMMELMKIKDEKRSGAEGFRMKNERLIELALGSEAATAEESVAMAMTLLNWHKGPKDEKIEDLIPSLGEGEVDGDIFYAFTKPQIERIKNIAVEAFRRGKDGKDHE